eukprot:6197531-Alexandrium_andersonii.AAC.1
MSASLVGSEMCIRDSPPPVARESTAREEVTWKGGSDARPTHTDRHATAIRQWRGAPSWNPVADFVESA